jgi:hypothetical protein
MHMRSSRIARDALLLCASLLAAGCAGAPEPKGRIDWDRSLEATGSLGSLGAADWKEDMKYLVDALEARHPNPWHAASRESFVATLGAPYPEGLAPDELAEARGARVAQALASIGEAHTRLVPQAEFDRVLPVGLSRGSGGFYVVAVGVARDEADSSPSEYSLLGGRVVSVNGVPAAEAFASLAPFCSAENALALLDQEAMLFQHRGILAAAGLVQRGAASALVEVERGGERIARALAFASRSGGELAALAYKDVFEYSGVEPPLAAGRGDPYWHAMIPGTGAMLLQYNQCANMKDKSFKDYCAELFEDIRTLAPERLIIDLRNNGGGDSNLFTREFLPRIKASRLNEKGRLYALIGPRVMSSGVFAAVELRTQARAILVGEGTGEGSTHYGYTGYFSLPRSGLAIMHSTRLWKLVPGDDSSEMTPDIMVPKDLEAMLAGRDPCLEAALAAR